MARYGFPDSLPIFDQKTTNGRYTKIRMNDVRDHFFTPSDVEMEGHQARMLQAVRAIAGEVYAQQPVASYVASCCPTLSLRWSSPASGIG